MLHYVDSAKRSSGTVTDFTFDLTLPINHNMVSLVNISFPRSNYLVEEGKNTFIISSSGVETEYVMDVGNYDELSFETAVTALIPGTCTINDRTAKLTITGTSGDFLIFPVGSTLYHPFGFLKESSNEFVDNQLESETVCNFRPLSRLYLTTDAVSDVSGHKYGSILEVIPINYTSDFSANTWFNTQIYQTGKLLTGHHPNQPSLISTGILFRLLDEDDNVVDFNNLSFQFTLKTWREKSNYDKFIEHQRISDEKRSLSLYRENVLSALSDLIEINRKKK